MLWRSLHDSAADAISAWQAVQEWPHIVKLSRQAEEDLLAAWHQIVPEKLYTRFLAAGCGAVCLDDAGLSAAFAPDL